MVLLDFMNEALDQMAFVKLPRLWPRACAVYPFFCWRIRVGWIGANDRAVDSHVFPIWASHKMMHRFSKAGRTPPYEPFAGSIPVAIPGW